MIVSRYRERGGFFAVPIAHLRERAAGPRRMVRPLADGRERTDITHHGDWRAYLKAAASAPSKKRDTTDPR